MFVRDCMTPNPTTIEPEAHLDDALGIMRALKVRHLPVLQGLRLVGILTWTDLMRAAPSSAAPLQAAETPSLLRRMRVKEVMTPDPITVSPDEPVEVAA
ncbi:MAG: CBS domain-containing protein, partial [Armatimonadetes bacterium]|nr:CBS domain-containing protein [Armatimonadota bacterium]